VCERRDERAYLQIQSRERALRARGMEEKIDCFTEKRSVKQTEENKAKFYYVFR
jgi:hypothetical protein